MRTREDGFTLVEVVIATVITSVMLLAVLGVFTVGQDVCNLGTANLAVQLLNTKSFAEMTRTIRESNIVSVSADGSTITLQKPVDPDDDGDVLNDANQIEWGAEYQGADHLGWYIRYAYVQDRVYRESLEGKGGFDLNRNGVTNDVFGLGRIVEEIWDNNGTAGAGDDVLRSSRAITPPYIVMTASPAIGGDVNGDGVGDVLFFRLNDQGVYDNTGHNIRISFFAFKATDNGRSVLLHPTTVVTARNF